MDSYDVRFWDIKKLGNGSAARHRVRWSVDGREHCRSFKARPLADGFLDGLKDAVRDRRPFSPRTGLPEAETTGGEMITWYAHARAYAETKWGGLAPVSRRSVAEALVTVTVALNAREPGAPDARVLRQALFAWAFNPATRHLDPPPAIAAALDWAARASLPVADLEDTATVRLALAACARTPDREGGGRVDAAAQAVGVLQRAGLRRRAGPPRIQPGRPHPVDHSRRRPERRPPGGGQPRPGQVTADRRAGAQ
jgi:hypothetical protein